MFTKGEGSEMLKKISSWFESLRSQLRQVRRHADIPDLLLSQGSDLSSHTPHVVTFARVINETAVGLLHSDINGKLCFTVGLE